MRRPNGRLGGGGLGGAARRRVSHCALAVSGRQASGFGWDRVRRAGRTAKRAPCTQGRRIQLGPVPSHRPGPGPQPDPLVEPVGQGSTRRVPAVIGCEQSVCVWARGGGEWGVGCGIEEGMWGPVCVCVCMCVCVCVCVRARAHACHLDHPRLGLLVCVLHRRPAAAGGGGEAQARRNALWHASAPALWGVFPQERGVFPACFRRVSPPPLRDRDQVAETAAQLQCRTESRWGS